MSFDSRFGPVKETKLKGTVSQDFDTPPGPIKTGNNGFTNFFVFRGDMRKKCVGVVVDNADMVSA